VRRTREAYDAYLSVVRFRDSEPRPKEAVFGPHLVTAIDYVRQIVFIKWVGSHHDYDKIDARTVQYGD